MASLREFYVGPGGFTKQEGLAASILMQLTPDARQHLLIVMCQTLPMTLRMKAASWVLSESLDVKIPEHRADPAKYPGAATLFRRLVELSAETFDVQSRLDALGFYGDSDE